MDQLTPQDALSLYMETDNNLFHVSTIQICDPSTRSTKSGEIVTAFMAHVEANLDSSPIYRRKLYRLPLELDYPYWIDDPFFDVQAHITSGTLPKPGTWEQFCDYIGHYHSRPMCMNRPLWEMHVVQGLNACRDYPQGCYAIIVKVHHAAVDGTSLGQLLGGLSDTEPGASGKSKPGRKTDEIPRSPKPKGLQIGYRAGRSQLLSPYRVAKTTAKSARALPQILKNIKATLPIGKSAAPRTRFRHSSSPHKIFRALDIPFEDMRQIRKLVDGATINDVVLAICSGALQRYLRHHNELPSKPLIAMVPINTRSASQGESESAGNNVSAMRTPIHTNVTDKIERLTEISRSTSINKEDKTPQFMSELGEHVPSGAEWVSSKLMSRIGIMADMSNLVVSNVAGPAQHLYLDGAKVLGNFGMAPLGGGLGLYIGTPSYAGRQIFSVTSTREAMPDIDFFLRCIEDSIDEYRAS